MDPDIATTAEAEEAQAMVRALPRVHEVHTDPNQPRPCEETLPCESRARPKALPAGPMSA